jgi:hypothetical protein
MNSSRSWLWRIFVSRARWKSSAGFIRRAVISIIRRYLQSIRADGMFPYRLCRRNNLQGRVAQVECKPPRSIMNSQERLLLESLDALLRLDAVQAQVHPIVERVAHELACQPLAPMAWEPIPLSIYGTSLPPSIRSSWVFILRAGATTGAERHPNSHQRMMSYHGTGDLQTGGDGHWQSLTHAGLDRLGKALPRCEIIVG